MGFEDALERLDRIVDAHGVAVQYVGPGNEEPPFAYTVGLSLVDHPEFLIEGLSIEISHQLLNDMALSVLRGHMRFDSGDLVDHLIASWPVALIAIAGAEQHLPAAVAIRDRRAPASANRDLKALQVVLPDRTGLFTWDDAAVSGAIPLADFVPSGSRLVLPAADERRDQGW